jgi:hypothetical protein
MYLINKQIAHLVNSSVPTTVAGTYQTISQIFSQSYHSSNLSHVSTYYDNRKLTEFLTEISVQKMSKLLLKKY